MKTISNYVLLSFLCIGMTDAFIGFSKSDFHNQLGNVKKTPEQIISDGYPVETHSIITRDGYVINMHRIPFSKRSINSQPTRKRVLFVPHCIFCSSITWVMLGKEKSLAYKLADMGYDVWLLNTRGTSYTNHTTYTSKSSKYWDFSLNEIGSIDAPTALEYVLDKTKVDQVDMLAFSMGTTVSFIMLATHPHLHQKVRRYIAIAPAVYFNDAYSPVISLTPFEDILKNTFTKIGVHYLPPRNWHINELLSKSCLHTNPFTWQLCRKIVFALIGGGIKGVSKKDFSRYLLSIPDTTSVKLVAHFAQIATSGVFKKYDYGKHGNMKRYNSQIPPIYNIRNISVPITLFSSEGDHISSSKDVERLRHILPNVDVHYKITDPKFTHMHFIWSTDADKVLYRHIINHLKT